MFPDLCYEFRLLAVIARGNGQHFSTLNRPRCQSPCRWCHYNTDTHHPILWNCRVWETFADHNARRRPNPWRWQLRAPLGNRPQRLAGASSELRGYLRIPSHGLGLIRRQKYGERDRQWWEWIKSLISSFIRLSRGSGNKCTRLFVTEISCIVGEITEINSLKELVCTWRLLSDAKCKRRARSEGTNSHYADVLHCLVAPTDPSKKPTSFFLFFFTECPRLLFTEGENVGSDQEMTEKMTLHPSFAVGWSRVGWCVFVETTLSEIMWLMCLCLRRVSL